MLPVPPLGRRHRLRQLFGRLLVERAVNRTVLAEEMWPDLSVDKAANNLRVTLAKLLAVVEPDRVEGTSWWIRAVDERLELAAEGLVIDIDEFERDLRLARSAESQGASSLAYDHYLSAVESYGGPLLPDIVLAVEIIKKKDLRQGIAAIRLCVGRVTARQAHDQYPQQQSTPGNHS